MRSERALMSRVQSCDGMSSVLQPALTDPVSRFLILSSCFGLDVNSLPSITLRDVLFSERLEKCNWLHCGR